MKDHWTNRDAEHWTDEQVRQYLLEMAPLDQWFVCEIGLCGFYQDGVPIVGSDDYEQRAQRVMRYLRENNAPTWDPTSNRPAAG
jgi:hypothetical protein